MGGASFALVKLILSTGEDFLLISRQPLGDRFVELGTDVPVLVDDSEGIDSETREPVAAAVIFLRPVPLPFDFDVEQGQDAHARGDNFDARQGNVHAQDVTRVQNGSKSFFRFFAFFLEGQVGRQQEACQVPPIFEKKVEKSF